ncbi:MAG: hypothetical protein HYR96_11695 [Deltaproteobacteria bacterium]|nr:hypothetical protein [Deltaproteobacteria bacterium]
MSVSCDGKDQPLEHHYTLSFNGAIGAYISKASNCTQLEPEKYRYLPDSKIAMKQGVRSCTPNPCAADLPATECGKETNPAEPLFDVGWGENKLLVISTNDVNAIDCTGPGQKKPAVFKLLRIK